jgi:hypothetical protein
VWWYTPVIPEFWRLRQENSEFQVSLANVMRPCLKKINEERKKRTGQGGRREKKLNFQRLNQHITRTMWSGFQLLSREPCTS